MTQTEVLQVLSGFIGSVGFAILFNIRGKRLLAATIGGMLSWLLFVILNTYIKNEVVTYFVVASIISIYAEIMARVLKSPVTTFNIISLIPMIPGGALYNTMVSAFKVDQNDFLQKGLHTLQLAAALALGVVVVTTLARLFQKLINHES